MGCNTSKEVSVAPTKRHPQQPSSQELIDEATRAIASAALARRERLRAAAPPAANRESPTTARSDQGSFPSSANNEAASLINFSFMLNPMIPPTPLAGTTSNSEQDWSGTAREVVASPTFSSSAHDGDQADFPSAIAPNEQNPDVSHQLPVVAEPRRPPAGRMPGEQTANESDCITISELNDCQQPRVLSPRHSDCGSPTFSSPRGLALRPPSHRRRHSSRSASVDSSADPRSQNGSAATSLNAAPAGSVDPFLNGCGSPKTQGMLLRKNGTSSFSQSRSPSLRRISGSSASFPAVFTTESGSGSMRGRTSSHSVSANTASLGSTSYSGGLDPSLFTSAEQIADIFREDDTVEDLICPTPPEHVNTPAMGSP